MQQKECSRRNAAAGMQQRNAAAGMQQQTSSMLTPARRWMPQAQAQQGHGHHQALLLLLLRSLRLAHWQELLRHQMGQG